MRSVTNAGIVLHIYICRDFINLLHIARHDWSRSILELRDQDFTRVLETKTSATWSQDRDLGSQVSSELEFETLGLEITSPLLVE